MTIPLIGSNGLFTRLGKMGVLLADINTFQGTTLPADVQDIVGQYVSNNDAAMIDGIETQLTSAQSSASSITGFLTTASASTVNTMVYQDQPLQSATNTTASLAYLINQMIADGDSVQACSVSSTVTADSGNLGNGVCVCSTKRSDGLVQENAFGEILTISCSQDSTTSSTLAGRESFSIQGQVNYTAYDWRYFTGGSAANTSTSAINGGSDNSNGNLLTNSDFENFTSNTPNNWSVLVGTAGTQIAQSTAQHYTGSASLKFVGDSSTLTSIAQTFGNGTSGTAGTLSSLTQYALCGWLKVDVVPAAGVLEVSLVDGSNTVINDQAGNPNTITVNLSSATTSWVPFSGSFRTPYILPSTIKIRVRLSTALSTGSNVFIDRLGLGTMTQAYTGGPSLAVFSGSNNFFKPDSFAAAVTNNRGGASNGRTFQTLYDRCFGMRSLGLLLPSSNSPTISDF